MLLSLLSYLQAQWHKAQQLTYAKVGGREPMTVSSCISREKEGLDV